MLHFEDRKSGQKGGYSLIASFLLLLLLMTGCNNWNPQKERNITTEAFSDMRTPAFTFDLQQVGKQIQHLADADKGRTEADRQTKAYYGKDGSRAMWVDNYGVNERADSLLAWLHLLKEIGMSELAFHVQAIEEDLQRMRELDFDEDKNQLNKVAARLEYRLTKACLRYCCGQRFGFVNPHQVFNHMDVEKGDSIRVIKYRGLFDVDMDLPTAMYVDTVFGKIKNDGIASYLREIQPSGNLYGQLKKMLATATTEEQQRRIMVNMERCRWRLHQPIAEQGKRIIVNIPAFHLYAYGPEGNLDMRVVCGSVNTKTPLLASNIEYMEVNPQWVIPMSIIRNEVAHRSGDSAYFARNRYNIYDRSTNRQIPAGSVSCQMLLSGRYRIAQTGGAGNSLGRIVFRFKNNFSVFLHDTSNPSAFSRDFRAMSHGCVRVAKPFDLARFVLDNPDEWLLERMRIAMGLTPETERGQEYVRSHPSKDERNKLISHVPVQPRVPLYIIYYTLWPDADGVLQTWPDVYGYDAAIWKQLKTYL